MSEIGETTTVQWDSALEAIERCYELGWTDGLPVVPPTEARVAEFIERTGRPSGEVVGELPERRREITVGKVAANAVMAGCLPEYMPVVLTATEAMLDPVFNLVGPSSSMGGSAILTIVNGPMVRELNINARNNLFGPGNRANATIGRTIRLTLLNVFRIVPGIADKSTQGNPGKYSFCIAERADRNPWPALCEEFGFPEGVSCVTVFAGAGFCNVENHGGNTPEAILDTMASAMANYGCISTGQSVVVLSPEHAEIVARTGWTKAEVRQYLFEHAKHPGRPSSASANSTVAT